MFIITNIMLGIYYNYLFSYILHPWIFKHAPLILLYKSERTDCVTEHGVRLKMYNLLTNSKVMSGNVILKLYPFIMKSFYNVFPLVITFLSQHIHTSRNRYRISDFLRVMFSPMNRNLEQYIRFMQIKFSLLVLQSHTENIIHECFKLVK